MKKNQKNLKNVKFFVSGSLSLLAIFSLIILLGHSSLVKADPAGATITTNVTADAPTYDPDNRSDAGGTITTLTMSVTQQDAFWKAYVGNITGTLTLDDSSGNTIYQWAMTNADITGEVYASRANNVDWSVVNCSNSTEIETEDTALGFSGTEVDTINKTFNESTHQEIKVAGRTIASDTCRSTATYVNDTKEDISSATFQEVLFQSGSDIIYASPLNQGSTDYTGLASVDFQLLLADDVTTAVTTYYFYVEIGG